MKFYILALSLGTTLLLCHSPCSSAWPAPETENATATTSLKEAVEEPIIAAKNSSVSEAKTKRTCACGDDGEESLICASNGITYKGTCKFNCAKARVSRLRIIRQGAACSQSTGTGSYWQKGFKG